MSVAISRGGARSYATEYDTTMVGRLYKGLSESRLGIVFQGLAGADYLYATSPYHEVGYELAEYGIPLINAQYGVTAQWGNATALSRMDDARTYANAALLPRTDKVVLVGQSKGGTAVLNWAKANPTLVAAIALFVPAVDIQDIYTNNRGGNQSSISTAYGGAPPDASNPADNTSSFTSFPIKIWYSTNDTTCTPETITAFASATGAELSSMGDVDHADWPVYPENEVLQFLAPYREPQAPSRSPTSRKARL